MGVYRALLDAGGVLRGFDEVDALQDDDVPAGDCDLEIGRYRWDGISFQLVKSPEPEDVVNAADTLVAIALGFDVIEQAGLVEFHPRTTRWLEWYRKTVDAKGFFVNEEDQANGDA